MKDIDDMSSDNSAEIDIDFDFDMNGGSIELEDIALEKALPFEDIEKLGGAYDVNETEAVSFDVADSTDTPFTDIKDYEVIPEKATLVLEEKVIELVDRVDIGKEGVNEEDSIIELVDIVKADFEQPDDIIELLEVVQMGESVAGNNPDNSGHQKDEAKITKEAYDRLSGDLQIESLVEKIVEKMYAEKLESILSSAMESILDRQLDVIRKKVLSALRDTDVA